MNARDANNKSIRDVIYAVLIVMLFDNRSVTLRCRAVRAVINRFGHNSQVYDESFLGRRKTVAFSLVACRHEIITTDARCFQRT
jgi:hypothetical protein